MNQHRPATRHTYRRNAPRQAPCPQGGMPGRRKQRLTRTVRGIAYGCVLLVHVTTAEYRARCGCWKTFRTQVEGVEPKAHYTNQVRAAVLDRLLDDHRSLERILAALRRDFGLELSTGFVYDCLRWQVGRCDHAAYRAWALQEFSGTLCLDEIHLGRFTLLLATDPLHDFPVAFALVSANDGDHRARFLGQLRDHGLHPRVVITDGSPLYPSLLARLWPRARHQLCAFHVLRDLLDYLLAAVRQRIRAFRRRASRPRRPRRRGRPTRQAARARQGRRSLAAQAAFVWKHRFLIVARRARLSAARRAALGKVLAYQPSLGELRRFADDLYRLFDPAQTAAQAWHRWEEVTANPTYRDDPSLRPLWGLLAAATFGKVLAFLGSPAGARQRTNNHAERTNRALRREERSRYRWRSARGMVRFVLLQIHRQWQRRLAEAAQEARPRPGPGGGGGTFPPPPPPRAGGAAGPPPRCPQAA